MSEKHEFNQKLTKEQLLAASAYITGLLDNFSDQYELSNRTDDTKIPLNSLLGEITRDIAVNFPDNNKIRVIGSLVNQTPIQLDVTAENADDPDNPF